MAPIRKAKQIHQAINDKAEFSDGHDDILSDDDSISDGEDPELESLLNRAINVPPLPPGDPEASVASHLLNERSSTTPSKEAESGTPTRGLFQSYPSVSKSQKSRATRASPGIESFTEFMQYSIMQRELDRQDRDRERAEERQRRSEDNRMMQQMFMYAIAGSTGKPKSDNDNDDLTS